MPLRMIAKLPGELAKYGSFIVDASGGKVR
jgi:hypothetical protein